MHYLPSALPDSNTRGWPLSNQAATELAACWLDEAAPSEVHQRRTVELLRAEPILAAWALLQASGSVRVTDPPAAPEIWASLARWLHADSQALWCQPEYPHECQQECQEAVSSFCAEDFQKREVNVLSGELWERWQTLRREQRERLAHAPEVRHGELLGICAEQCALLASEIRSMPTAAGEVTSVPTNEASAEHVEPSFEQHADELQPQPWLGQLARRLYRARELELRFDLAVRDEKLRALKEFAYGASHELNNPLANISTRAQTLLYDERDPERRRKLATMHTQAMRAHEMISDLMLFAHPPQLQCELLDLVPFVTAVLAEVQADADAQQTRLEFHSATTTLPLEADPRHLAVALRALLQNSLEALGQGGHIQVTLRPIGGSEFGAEQGAELRVQDDGSGVPSELRARIFDPYFSGREAGRGLGLGLSKAWRIAALHGGQLTLEDDTPGATLKMRLPVGKSER